MNNTARRRTFSQVSEVLRQPMVDAQLAEGRKSMMHKPEEEVEVESPKEEKSHEEAFREDSDDFLFGDDDRLPAPSSRP